MNRFYQKSAALFVLPILVAVFCVAPRISHAQVCTGVCINITPLHTSGGSDSDLKTPSNLLVALNAGDACTTTQNVILHLEFSNVVSVMISPDDNFDDDTWIPVEGKFDQVNPPYGSNKEIIQHEDIPWTLSGVGEQAVYVRFQGFQNNKSATYSDSIMVDLEGKCSIGTSLVVYPGEYIKGENFPGVYYISDDLERQPFYLEPIFFTWQKDFSAVQVVADDLLPTIPLGPPRLPKAGTTLVKFPSDPKVYYVDPATGGTFRWVADEALAVGNFGSDWKEFLIDIPETLFPVMTFGDPIVSVENIDRSLLIPNLLLSGSKFTNDFDGDGLTDFAESQFGSDLRSPDTDKDGLSDGDEYRYGTDPLKRDSDADGFTDGEEVADGFNPLGNGVLDSDGDGLTDPQELYYGTDRWNTDTDGDGYSDKVEIDNGFDPNGPGLLSRETSGYGLARYAASAVNLVWYKVRALFSLK